MIKCPSCNKATEQARYEGWVVRAKGSVVFAEDNTVQQVGPMVVVSCVKAGQEINGHGIEVICPGCGHRADIKQFPRVMPCFVTGMDEADVEIDLPAPLGRVHVNRNAVDAARAMFNPADMEPNDNILLANVIAKLERG